jgi:hypothetical protein
MDKDIHDMSVGELIHTMLVEFDPDVARVHGKGHYLQNGTYFAAVERLNEVFGAVTGARSD